MNNIPVVGGNFNGFKVVGILIVVVIVGWIGYIIWKKMRK